MAHIDDIEKSGLTHQRSKTNHIANPASLGLFSFASTTFILSLYNLQTRGIQTPNVVVGMAVFCGGLAQLLAGMWEFPRGNVFGATAFTSYGAFWMSYATILIPGSGVLAAYTSVHDLQSALGIYLMAWFMVTFFLFLASFKKNVGLLVLFAFLDITFLLLGIATFIASVPLTKAGGAVGVLTALVAFYVGFVDLMAADGVQLPIGPLN